MVCVRCVQRRIGSVMPIEPSSLVFTPTTMATMESTLGAFENELAQSSDCFSDDDSSQDWSEWQQQPTNRSGLANPARRLPGPKSSVRTEDMTPVEIRRRDRRRERNKLAAARCRQRRLDITHHLLAVSSTVSCCVTSQDSNLLNNKGLKATCRLLKQ